jgi:hypothetical protein
MLVWKVFWLINSLCPLIYIVWLTTALKHGQTSSSGLALNILLAMFWFYSFAGIRYSKSKLSHYRHVGAKGERRNSSSFLTSALEGVSGQRHAPAALYHRGKDPRYPMDWRMVWSPEKKSFCLCRESNVGRPVCSQTLYCLLRYFSLSFIVTVWRWLRLQTVFWRKDEANLSARKLHGSMRVINKNNNCKKCCAFLGYGGCGLQKRKQDPDVTSHHVSRLFKVHLPSVAVAGTLHLIRSPEMKIRRKQTRPGIYRRVQMAWGLHVIVSTARSTDVCGCQCGVGQALRLLIYVTPVTWYMYLIHRQADMLQQAVCMRVAKGKFSSTWSLLTL